MNNNTEPYFQLMVLMELKNVNKLLLYESYFHKKGFDTINRAATKYHNQINAHAVYDRNFNDTENN